MPSLLHEMRVFREQPRDIGENATKQAELLDEARARDLKTTVGFDNWNVQAYVFGPEAPLRDLLVRANARGTYPELVP